MPRSARSAHTRFRAALAALLLAALLLAGCSATPSRAPRSTSAGSIDPTPSQEATATVAGGIASASSVASASATAAPTGVIGPPPIARPYGAEVVLQAMATSRRPGGVPDQLQTEAIAAGLAQQIWTYLGGPYPTLVVGASCGPSSCTVEVTGAPAGAAGADLYAFSVAPASSTVVLAATDLHGYPSGLDARIDRVVRDRLGAAALAGLALTGATWQPPPQGGVFVAAYRSGGEEHAPGLDVTVNLVTGTVTDTAAP